MDLERNQSLLSSTAQIANAGRAVYQIVKLLRMQRTQFEEMFREDVLDQIVQPDLGGLAAYARGLRDAYITTILLEHCAFVYVLSDGREVQLSQVREVDPVYLAEATCGYRWKDSDWDFGEFHPVLTP